MAKIGSQQKSLAGRDLAAPSSRAVLQTVYRAAAKPFTSRQLARPEALISYGCLQVIAAN
jgi:hypothetical protein